LAHRDETGLKTIAQYSSHHLWYSVSNYILYVSQLDR
jgi:hypothetical protein